MASGLKVIAALGAIAAGAAAIFAFKKHKELENYDYEDLDEATSVTTMPDKQYFQFLGIQ